MDSSNSKRWNEMQEDLVKLKNKLRDNFFLN